MREFTTSAPANEKPRCDISNDKVLDTVYQNRVAPPDFLEVMTQLSESFDDAELAEVVRHDATTCGTLFELIPTISRYADEIDPVVMPRAASEVAHQIIAATRGDAQSTIQWLATKYPAWENVLVSALFARDLLGEVSVVPCASDVDGEDTAQSTDSGITSGSVTAQRDVPLDVLVDGLLAALPNGIGPLLADGQPRFLLCDVRSRGSFGVVVDAVDRAFDLGSRVASDEGSVVVKFLFPRGNPSHHADESHLSVASKEGLSSSTEAMCTSAIDHPCGVKVRHEGTVVVGAAGESVDYIVFERVAGISLVDLAARGELPRKRALRAITALCDALAELHAAGWVHGDLSPSNVMLDALGQFRLIDYGLSQRATPTSRAADVVRAAELTQWIVLGYVPRETVHRHPLRAWAEEVGLAGSRAGLLAVGEKFRTGNVGAAQMADAMRNLNGRLEWFFAIGVALGISVVWRELWPLLRAVLISLDVFNVAS